MAVNYLLKLIGIQGETKDLLYDKHIRLMNWNWGANNLSSVAGTKGSGAGKVNFDQFTFMTQFERSTPKFFRTICAGTHIDVGTLLAFKAGERVTPYLTLNFKKLFITNVATDGQYEIPTASVAFSFKELTIEYRIQNDKGNLISTGPVSYSLKENKSS